MLIARLISVFVYFVAFTAAGVIPGRGEADAREQAYRRVSWPRFSQIHAPVGTPFSFRITWINKYVVSLCGLMVGLQLFAVLNGFCQLVTLTLLAESLLSILTLFSAYLAVWI